jgi:DNA polymerase (family 10)
MPPEGHQTLISPYNLSMENRNVAKILRETAQLLEIDGALYNRYRSYERVAELLENLSERIEDIARDLDKLTELPGIGDRMAEHIQEILRTGDYSVRQKLLKKFPATLLQVVQLQSLGPKKAALIWSAYKAGTVAEVQKLAEEGKLRLLPGFGEKSEQNIVKAAAVFNKAAGRFLINTAEAAAEKLIEHIQKLGGKIELVSSAGSLRRGRETIGDLDFIVLLPKDHPPEAIDTIAQHILAFPAIEQTLARGGNKVSFLMANGMQVDVRMIEKESYGAAMLYFTGSKEHNVSLRSRALKMGYTLNEYALSTVKGEKRVGGASEEEIYAKLKLDFIPPELRENSGEIDAAESHALPALIELRDILGDLQMHTVASDGKNSIEEMGEAAHALGYEYIAITDHSKAVTVANGMDEKRTLEQAAKIRAANARVKGIRLLAGIEVDILKSGKLDLDDEVLAQLDVVVASVHSYMKMERAEMMERLLAAIENPYTQIIAHPTGRLLLRREPFEYDMEKVLDACRKNGVAMECNSYPDRLDLRDVHLKMARERGVRIVISTDSHSTRHLPLMRYGVVVARRGWLEKKDVLNVLPLEGFLGALRPKPGVAQPVHKPKSVVGRKTRERAAGRDE